MAKYEILMAGSGGQGLVFAASFLARSAIAAGRNVVQTQTYGIAQRGGFISAEVIISDEEILYQQVLAPDIIIALSDEVGTRYDHVASPVLYDDSLMASRAKPNWFGVPCSRIAREIGTPNSANMVAVGAAMALCNAVAFDDMRATAMAGAGKAELLVEALTQGMLAAQQYAAKEQRP